jgi:hypothetical protein
MLQLSTINAVILTSLINQAPGEGSSGENSRGGRGHEGAGGPPPLLLSESATGGVNVPDSNAILSGLMNALQSMNK